MTARYNPSEIEPKWQQIWHDDQRYRASDNSDKPKYYVTGMFPYPSGAGMHTGHFFEHAIVDAVARFHRAHGHNVMYPMGFDNFGLPAENYAIKTGVSPQKATAENIANFKTQLNRVGASIDWAREVQTSDPEYYKWTQWIFTQLYERGLAYQKESLQWWCPVDKTVLANEQVEAGKCWRCGTDVEKKSMKQWFFTITDYADALLDEIPTLDWPEKIKTAQANWIGRSEGAEIQFGLDITTKDSLKFTPELTQLILDGEKTSTIRLEAKGVKVGEYVDMLTRDGEVVTPFGKAKITTERQMKLGEIPNDLAGHESFKDEAEKLENYKKYYGDQITLDTEFTIYDFEFLPDITVFSTRPDTLFGATFLVLAPEHTLARQLATDDTRETVNAYIDEAVKKSEIERQSEGKEKTGIWTGSYAINPATGEKIPIWIADYVLGGYGTGAIMAVPAHDERDYEFAEKFGLPIKQVIVPSLLDQANPPREGKENTTRNVVMCLIEHPSDGTFLTLKWDKLGWHNFVMGGIEDGETAEQAARREIAEETGYTDIVFVDSLPLVMKSRFYAAHKDLNRDINTTVLRFKLGSLDSIATKKEAHEDFTTQWVEQSELYALQPVAELDYILAWLKSKRVMFHGEGVLINSGTFDGMESSEAREEIVAWLEQQGTGRAKTTYKMRDWLISRQRYWGAPIPIIHCEEHGAVAVPADQLPVVLPDVEDFAPKGDGKSPLARQDEWVNTTCPTCGRPAKRETDVMDGYACSSWYLLRYTDPHNSERAWSPELANYWAPLDMYIGGDHAVAHLLYVRFWNHVFYDMGLVPSREPVKKLVYHGLIQAEDGRKMSKSLGNVVDPLDIIDQGYGADALRTFELFLGPVNENSNWSSRGIVGTYKFLNRTWTLVQEYLEARPDEASDNKQLQALQHRTVKKVTTDIHKLSFNTAIAALMEYVNELYKLKVDGFDKGDWRAALTALVQLLSPFAPHMSAELWQQLGHDDRLDFAQWPEWDDALTVAETLTIVVQVGGKVRAKLSVAADASESDIKAQALADPNVVKFVGDKKPTKVIYVPGRLVNVVT